MSTPTGSTIKMTSERSAAQEKTAGLARIRDNQRRSRARKKEYITELEDKNKYCEQLGVEASIELQTAARLVLAENQKLRALLKRLGYSDADIDRECSAPFEQSPASIVQDLLDKRRSCRPSSKSDITDGQTPQSFTSSKQYATTDIAPNLDFPADPASFHMVPQLLPASSTVYGDTSEPIAAEASEFHQIPDSARSCQDAAGMLRSLHPDLGQELEQQLGCGYEQNDCNVSNNQLFQVLDRYG